MGIYRVKNTADIAIIDLSALRGWKFVALQNLASRFRLAIPECLFAELLTNKDQGVADKMLRRLEDLPFVCIDTLGEHLEWEVRFHEPVGLLLNDDECRAFPEKSARIMAERLRREVLNSTQGLKAIQDFVEGFDRPDELLWEEISKAAIAAHAEGGMIDTVRKAGKKEFFSTWKESTDQMEAAIRPQFSAFVSGITGEGIHPPSEDIQRGMNLRWVVYRAYYLIVLYVHINLIDNPGAFTHARLNQRLDHRYLAMLDNKMALVTGDREMADLASIIAPEARVIRCPGDLTC